MQEVLVDVDKQARSSAGVLVRSFDAFGGSPRLLLGERRERCGELEEDARLFKCERGLGGKLASEGVVPARQPVGGSIDG